MTRFSMLAVAFACALAASNGALADSDGVRIKTLSNRADLVSSGDALVEVRLGEDRRAGDVVLRLNGADVTGQFTYQRDARRFLGVVKGLVEGSNKLTAHARKSDGRKGRDGDDRDHGRGKERLLSSLTITNHSRGGPIFSGPQIQPWICATVAGATVNVTIPGTGLTSPVVTRISGLDAEVTDAKCNAPSRFTYYYQPRAKQGTDCTFTINPGTATAPLNPCFVALNPAAPPSRADIADFTNDRGVTVKSIVRVERGTMNRGIYEIVSFHDPAQTVPGALPVGWERQGRQHRDDDDGDDDDDRHEHRRDAAPAAPSAHDGWNGKLLWMFGASAAAHKLQAPTTLNTIFNDPALRAGYMVASASLNNNGTNANHVLAAESVMMVKEHIAEQYGRIRYTIGNGCSGGSIQQQTIASTYPGLLDGIQPNCSYQDQANIEMEIKDCGLLSGNYFAGPGAALSDAKRAAIGGQLNPGFCNVWVPSFVPAYDPKRSANCGPGFPAALTYDPVLRPGGVRCTIPDHEAVRLGTFIDTDGVRKANNTFDNSGVQYGLKALRAGAISAEEFVRLNEGVGSYSSDLVWSGTGLAAGARAPRIGASSSVVANLYYTGVSGDARFLEDVAIIDLRGNQNPLGDIHANWRSWALRERLNAANGHHDNQVIWAFTPGLAPGFALARHSFLTMDSWLAAVEADDSKRRSRADKIIANRPVAARDWCMATNGATDAQLTEAITLNVALDSPACPVKYQASPRQVAGGPITEDIFKCALKPLNFSEPDYATLDAAQRSRLAAVFPAGVCDWSQPGIGKQTSPGWMTYASGVAVPLPRPPGSGRH